VWPRKEVRWTVGTMALEASPFIRTVYSPPPRSGWYQENG